MKKQFLALALAATLILPLSTMAADVLESTISVDSTANSELAPDTAVIRFYIENSGTNLAEIKDKNDKIANTAIADIKKKLNKDETIKTIAFRVNNVYSYKDKVRIFQKYEVVNGFEVKLKDLNKVSEIIKVAMNDGVKRVDNLNFSIENGQDACNILMAKAISMAKARAQHLSSAAGAELGKIKNINPYCSLNSSFVQPRYLNTSMKSAGGVMDGAEASMDESIEPGSINVRASVNMTYYLK